MKKTLLLLTILSVLLLPLITAENNIFSNATYNNQATIQVGTIDYKLTIASGKGTGIQLERPEELLIMGEGDCKRFNTQRLCHEKKITNTSVRLVIYDLKANVEIQLLAEEKTYTSGDNINLTIHLNNTGEREAEQALMQLRLPKNTTIEETDDCSYNDTHIYWQGTIREHDEETCKAVLQFTGALDETITATINYTSFNISLRAESEPAHLEAQQNFDYFFIVPEITTIEPGQPFTLNLTITNKEEDHNLSIQEFKLEHYGELELVNTNLTKLKERNTYLTLQQTIENGTTLQGHITLQSPYLDKEGTFKTTFTYNTTKDPTLRTFTEEYDYKTIELPLRIETEPSQLTYEALETAEIKLWVINPYEHFTFKGYEATITSDVGERELIKTPYGKKKHLTTLTYELPDTLTTKKEPVQVALLAKTDQGQLTTTTKTLQITILPLKGITTHTTTKKEDNITLVTVTATNNHQQPVMVTFNDIMPEGVFTNGITTKTIELTPQQETTIYEYKITTTKPITTADIQTTYQYNYLEKDVNELITTTLHNLTPQPPTNKPIITNTTNTTNTEEQVIERQNPSLLHVIIAASILLTFVIIIILRKWLQHIFFFKIRHKKTLKEYQELLANSALIRKRKQELTQEQAQLQKRLGTLEQHIQTYEQQLPKKISHLDQVIQRDEASEEKLAKVHHSIEELKKRVAAREQLLQEKEASFKNHEQTISSEKQKLQEDDQLLQQDAKLLKEEQEKLTKELELLEQEKQKIANNITRFKNKHVNLVHNKITLLSKQKKKMLDYHNQIIQEEDVIKDEFKKLQEDLNISKEELERAEKIYKQTTTEQNKQDEELKKSLQ